MSVSKCAFSWDDTIKPSKPLSLSNNFKSLSLSPENKRKRRYEDDGAPTLNAAFAVQSKTANSASSSPTSIDAVTTPSVKRSRISQPSIQRRNHGLLETRRRLEAMDKQQLINLLEDLVDRQPQLCHDIENLAAPLTSSKALSVLKKYLREVEESLPLGSGHSDYAFLRVRPQWTSFFVALADYTHFFLECEEIDITKTFEFLDGATVLVHSAPVWDSGDNNALLVRAYGELGQAWTSLLSKAQDALSYVFITGCAWETRFQYHCQVSKGRMTDCRQPRPADLTLMRMPEGVTS